MIFVLKLFLAYMQKKKSNLQNVVNIKVISHYYFFSEKLLIATLLIFLDSFKVTMLFNESLGKKKKLYILGHRCPRIMMLLLFRKRIIKYF